MLKCKRYAVSEAARAHVLMHDYACQQCSAVWERKDSWIPARINNQAWTLGRLVAYDKIESFPSVSGSL